MWEDPIVAEVHRTRERLAAECGMTVKAVFADLRKRQAALGDRLVRQPKRPGATAPIERGHLSPSPDLPLTDRPSAR